MALHAGGPSGSREFFEANAAFHDAIFAAAGNHKLREMYRQLLGQIGRSRRRALSLRGSLQRSVSEHRAVLRRRRGRRRRGGRRGCFAEHIRVPQLRLQELGDDEFRAILGPRGGKPFGHRPALRRKVST